MQYQGITNTKQMVSFLHRECYIYCILLYINSASQANIWAVGIEFTVLWKEANSIDLIN